MCHNDDVLVRQQLSCKQQADMRQQGVACSFADLNGIHPFIDEDTCALICMQTIMTASILFV